MIVSLLDSSKNRKRKSVVVCEAAISYDVQVYFSNPEEKFWKRDDDASFSTRGNLPGGHKIFHCATQQEKLRGKGLNRASARKPILYRCECKGDGCCLIEKWEVSEFGNEKGSKRAENTYRFRQFLPAHPFASRRSHRCRLISISTNGSHRQRQLFPSKPAFSRGWILDVSNGKTGSR